ncbi:MAG: ribonuclease HI family protein [Synergistaceae bacterium]|jgi:ribonuclease HI|nr:ribonuclease HI family protein [Synergistaceae bacterium]
MVGYFDGASRGNPGNAGAGACLLDDGGNVVWSCADYLGAATNNVAEYEALLRLLREVRSRGIKRLEIRGDSKLVVSQVGRKWKINSEHLRELAVLAWDIMAGMEINLVWIPREQNKIADSLSNRAIDKEQ